MDFGEWITKLPLWAVFLLTLAICIGAVEAGTALAGIALRRKKEKEPEAPLGSVVAALLGLLAFILAFTFGMTACQAGRSAGSLRHQRQHFLIDFPFQSPAALAKQDGQFVGRVEIEPQH